MVILLWTVSKIDFTDGISLCSFLISFSYLFHVCLPLISGSFLVTCSGHHCIMGPAFFPWTAHSFMRWHQLSGLHQTQGEKNQSLYPWKRKTEKETPDRLSLGMWTFKIQRLTLLGAFLVPHSLVGSERVEWRRCTQESRIKKDTRHLQCSAGRSSCPDLMLMSCPSISLLTLFLTVGTKEPYSTDSLTLHFLLYISLFFTDYWGYKVNSLPSFVSFSQFYLQVWYSLVPWAEYALSFY